MGLRLVGGCYLRGSWQPGWTDVKLDTGEIVLLPDCTQGPDQPGAYPGMLGPLREADQRGYDTQEFRQRLAVWVQLGTMPLTT